MSDFFELLENHVDVSFKTIYFYRFALSGVSVAGVWPDCQNHCRLMADGESGRTGLHVQGPVEEVCRRPRGNAATQGNQAF